MNRTTPYFIASYCLFVAGCSSLTGYQPPAPVYEPYPRTSRMQKPEPVVPAPPPRPQAVETTPLEPSAPPAWATKVERYEPERLSPVVVALLSDAEKNTGSGDLDAAVSTLERGLRIEPRNATLVYKLAEVRLKQSQPRLAEDLAKKAALLAGADRVLKKKSWLLVAKARVMQGDNAGAQEAEQKAAGL
ncbi:MAG: tetratricopeptide repeat protein [Gammaproteobacteria bacterium]